MQPYAGPVVITGWEDTYGQSDEIRDLTALQVSKLGFVLDGAQSVLHHDPDGSWAAVALGTWLPGWFPSDMHQRMTRYAETVLSDPDPQTEMLYDEDAMAWLTRRAAGSQS
jgi:hypothetical protein